MIVATWAVKTCLVLALAYPARNRIPQAYRDLFQTRSPSDKQHVAIAAFSGDEKLTTLFHFQPIVVSGIDPGKPSSEAPNVFFMTIAIGHFIGQMVYTLLPISFSAKREQTSGTLAIQRRFCLAAWSVFRCCPAPETREDGVSELLTLIRAHLT